MAKLTYNLLRELVSRDLGSRFKGSAFGFLWIIAQPVLMLTIYTFVFGSIFNFKQAAFSSRGTGLDFAIFLYSGLIFLQVTSEVLTRTPSAITSNPNFVKKVIFPVFALPLVTVITALINGLIGAGILVLAALVIHGLVGLKLLLLFLVLPLMFPLLFGLALIFSAVGVFVRDLAQIAVLMTTILTFASPIFYRLDQVPSAYRNLFQLNPIAVGIESVRFYVFGGEAPSITAIIFSVLFSITCLTIGLVLFKNLKVHFADVL